MPVEGQYFVIEGEFGYVTRVLTEAENGRFKFIFPIEEELIMKGVELDLGGRAAEHARVLRLVSHEAFTKQFGCFGEWHGSAIFSLDRLARILTLEGVYAEGTEEYRETLAAIQLTTEMIGDYCDTVNRLPRRERITSLAPIPTSVLSFGPMDFGLIANKEQEDPELNHIIRVDGSPDCASLLQLEHQVLWLGVASRMFSAIAELATLYCNHDWDRGEQPIELHDLIIRVSNQMTYCEEVALLRTEKYLVRS